MHSEKTTCYLLIGGSWKRDDESVEAVCDSITRLAPKPRRILICLFGKEIYVRNERFERIRTMFRGRLGEVECELAALDTFAEQSERSDVVYFDDGDNLLTEQEVGKIDHLKESLPGRLVVASSAGANVLSSAYFTRTYNQVRDGLGILPIKFIAHYGTAADTGKPVDWQLVKHELQIHGDTSLPVYTLEEGKFVVLDESGSVLYYS
jgi:hypothetical protein